VLRRNGWARQKRASLRPPPARNWRSEGLPPSEGKAPLPPCGDVVLSSAPTAFLWRRNLLLLLSWRWNRKIFLIIAVLPQLDRPCFSLIGLIFFSRHPQRRYPPNFLHGCISRLNPTTRRYPPNFFHSCSGSNSTNSTPASFTL